MVAAPRLLRDQAEQKGRGRLNSLSTWQPEVRHCSPDLSHQLSWVTDGKEKDFLASIIVWANSHDKFSLSLSLSHTHSLSLSLSLSPGSVSLENQTNIGHLFSRFHYLISHTSQRGTHQMHGKPCSRVIESIGLGTLGFKAKLPLINWITF